MSTDNKITKEAVYERAKRFGIDADALMSSFTKALNEEIAKDPLSRVLRDIRAERDRQEAERGEQNLPDGTCGPGTRPAREHSRRYREQLESVDALTWETLLTEAYSWAMAEDDPAALRGGLVRLAARATEWVEAIDRRTTQSSAVTSTGEDA